jgi:hypothetical protein
MPRRARVAATVALWMSVAASLSWLRLMDRLFTPEVGCGVTAS